MAEEKRLMELKVPADMEYALIVRMALSGFGMLAGLEVGLIEDLRTVTDECFDCLMHQAVKVSEIQVSADLREGRLWCGFHASRGEEALCEPLQDHEITRCILETLLPEVRLRKDQSGVYGIDFSMPV